MFILFLMKATLFYVIFANDPLLATRKLQPPHCAMCRCLKIGFCLDACVCARWFPASHGRRRLATAATCAERSDRAHCATWGC